MASAGAKDGPSSTPNTLLLLEGRPSSLPPKSPAEEARHARAYAVMVASARRQQEREQQVELQRQRAHEKQRVRLTEEWTTVVLPHWAQLRDSKQLHTLLWAGVPDAVRGQVWTHLVEGDLPISEDMLRQLEEECSRWVVSHEPSTDQEMWTEAIHLDATRTFPNLESFQADGALTTTLEVLLRVHCVVRSDLG